MPVPDQVTRQIAQAAFDEVLTPTALGRSPASLAAVVDATGSMHVAAHGHPHRDDRSTTADTIFRIASMSKSFFAAAVLSLRDEGAIDLHAPLRRYLPSARVTWRGAPVDVTLHQLMSNASGMPEDNAYIDRHLDMTAEEMHAVAERGIDLAAPPGLAYQYSNLGMGLVALAVQETTGRSVQELVRSRLLRPLALGATGYSLDEVAGRTGRDVAALYRTFDGGASFVEEPFVADGMLGSTGGMFSSLQDLSTWIQFLWSALTEEPQAPEVLDPASRVTMQRVHTLIPVGQDRADRLDGVGYGYGLVVEHDRRFGRVVQHTGGLPGLSSHMRWHAATGVAVITLGNTEVFGAAGLGQRILTHVLTQLDAPSDQVRVWPQARAAARQVDHLVRAGALRAAEQDPVDPVVDHETFAAMRQVAADNLLADVPPAVRARRLGEALRVVGRPRSDQSDVDDRMLPTGQQASVRWRIDCERGALICDAWLVALDGPQVQGLTISVADEHGRAVAGEPPAAAHHVRLLTDEPLPDDR